MPVVAATLDTTYEFAQDLLSLCETLLADTEDLAVQHNPGGEIARTYVGFGNAVGSGGPLCEELSVSFGGFGEAQTSGQSALSAGRRHIYGRVNLVTFIVTVVRDCVPVLDEAETGAPEVERIEESARELMRDASALWSGIYREMEQGLLFGGACSELFMLRCDPLEPMGDLAGFVLVLAAQIDGIRSDGSS